ncbi:MAG: hypothetical protein JWO78_1070 [Micavibrio sp.]|nr:hypothetical protein [Micavibrio sp.]
MLKELRKLAYLSMALVAISYGSQPASSAVSLTSAGACTGVDFASAGYADCVTTTGHISASVVSTLSINELRAISFGNMSKPCGGAACTGADATIALNAATGVRTYTAGTDTINLLHGASANDGLGGNAGNANSGGQSPGVLEVKGAFEGAATQVYISFADNAGNPVDFAGENYWTANDDNIQVANAGATAYFTVKDFTIDCPGSTNYSDVYGHFCDNAGANTAFQVKVGATLTTAAQTYTEGKYTGTYNAMVSY